MRSAVISKSLSGQANTEQKISPVQKFYSRLMTGSQMRKSVSKSGVELEHLIVHAKHTRNERLRRFIAANPTATIHRNFTDVVKHTLSPRLL